MTRRSPLIATALLSLLVLAGCSASDDGSDASGAMPAEMPAAGSGAHGGAYDTSDESASMDYEATGADAGAADTSVQTQAQQVIVTGSVSMEVDDPIATADEIAQLAVKAGGRVDASSQTAATDSYPASARLTLRLPASKTTETVSTIKKLGRNVEEDVSTEDVTTQMIDLDERIKALETSCDRLIEMMSKATATKDLISLEDMLTTRQAELQSLKGQRAYLKDLVSLSTISVNLSAPPIAPTVAPVEGQGFGDAFIDGWNAFVSFWAAIAKGLLASMWFLILAAAIAVPIVIVAKRRSKRRAAARAQLAPIAVPGPAPAADPAPVSGEPKAAEAAASDPNREN